MQLHVFLVLTNHIPNDHLNWKCDCDENFLKGTFEIWRYVLLQQTSLASLKSQELLVIVIALILGVLDWEHVCLRFINHISIWFSQYAIWVKLWPQRHFWNLKVRFTPADLTCHFRKSWTTGYCYWIILEHFNAITCLSCTY